MQIIENLNYGTLRLYSHSIFWWNLWCKQREISFCAKLPAAAKCKISRIMNFLSVSNLLLASNQIEGTAAFETSMQKSQSSSYESLSIIEKAFLFHFIGQNCTFKYTCINECITWIAKLGTIKVDCQPTSTWQWGYKRVLEWGRKICRKFSEVDISQSVLWLNDLLQYQSAYWY